MKNENKPLMSPTAQHLLSRRFSDIKVPPTKQETKRIPEG